jgi:hypothetical protein
LALCKRHDFASRIFRAILFGTRQIPYIHACFRMLEISSRSKKWIWSEFSISGLALSGTYYLPSKRAKLVGMVGFSTLLKSEVPRASQTNMTQSLFYLFSKGGQKAAG